MLTDEASTIENDKYEASAYLISLEIKRKNVLLK